MRSFIDVPLKPVRPFYGIEVGGLHWYLRYMNHHVEHLKMFRSRFDPLVPIPCDHGQLTVVSILQVDDSMTISTHAFMKEEEAASIRYRSKPKHAEFDKVNLVQ